MGANFVCIDVNGRLTREELKEKFEDYQEQDTWENGHSYSGGLGMCAGLKIEEKIFNSYEEAEEYISDVAQKWEEAIAVKAKHKDTEIWVIGGWCAC